MVAAMASGQQPAGDDRRVRWTREAEGGGAGEIRVERPGRCGDDLPSDVDVSFIGVRGQTWIATSTVKDYERVTQGGEYLEKDTNRKAAGWLGVTKQEVTEGVAEREAGNDAKQETKHREKGGIGEKSGRRGAIMRIS